MARENDESEIYPAKIRIRKGGLQLLQNSLTEDGFFNVGTPRVSIVDNELYIEIPSNAGSTSKYVFLGFEVFVPLKGKKNEEVADSVGSIPVL